MRFAVDGIAGRVASAKLRLRSTGNTIHGVAVHAAGGGWTETGVNVGQPARLHPRRGRAGDRDRHAAVGRVGRDLRRRGRRPAQPAAGADRGRRRHLPLARGLQPDAAPAAGRDRRERRLRAPQVAPRPHASPSCPPTRSARARTGCTALRSRTRRATRRRRRRRNSRSAPRRERRLGELRRARAAQGHGRQRVHPGRRGRRPRCRSDHGRAPPRGPGRLHRRLAARATTRVTDRAGGPATIADVSLPVAVPCAATPAGIGATCAVNTTLDAINPGTSTRARARSGSCASLELLDGGPDGDIATPDNTVFARPGLFVP